MCCCPVSIRRGAIATDGTTNDLQLAADIASEEEEEEEDEEGNESDDSEVERGANKALTGANSIGGDSDGEGAGMGEGSDAESEGSDSGAFKGTGKGAKEDKSRKGTNSRKKDKVGRKVIGVVWVMCTWPTEITYCSPWN